MHAKWVSSMVEYNKQQVPKGQLVVKDFEEPSKKEILDESPTCPKDTLRVESCIVAQEKWHLNQKILTQHFYREIT